MVDGETRRVHLHSVWQQCGEPPKELEPSECHEDARYLWGYFRELSGRRTSSGYGPNPLSHQEVRAWEERAGVKLTSFENEVLDGFEALFLNTHMKRLANRE